MVPFESFVRFPIRIP